MNVSRTLSTLCAAAALGLLVPPAGCSASAPPPAEEPPSPAAPPSASAPPAAPVAAPEPPPVAHRYAVACENATAAKAAMDVLERGGSAADAAIAGILAVGVAHPVSSGIGGGGFALAYDAKTKKVTVLDFRETAPMGIRAADYLKRPPPDEKRGVMTGVPGEVKGLAEIHARWGKLSWSDDARGAIDAAKQGFPISEHMHRALAWNDKWLRATPKYQLWMPGGALLAAGEKVTNPSLAATLQRIASEGAKAFYEGPIADDILATARAAGSHMVADDLRRYRVVAREPLTTRWEGYDVFTMPPPSAGGLLMLETLHMHTKAELTALGYGTAAYEHLLAETFRGAVADRLRAVGDPAFVKVDTDALAAPARMKARRARISLDATTPPERFRLDESGTSHLVTIDAEGNIVSITSTVNNMFGAKLLAAGGFLLNDELDDFTQRDVELRFGALHGPNAPRGGARPVSSMTPTIVLRDGAPVLSLGGSGGMRIATGVTQVLLAELAFDRPAQQAVADPRIDTPPMGGLLVDKSVPDALVDDLRRRGEVVDSTKPNFSAVQSIAVRERDGVRRLEAGADPRKGGSALVQ